MQEYLQKTRLGAIADYWGVTALLLVISVLFFAVLWGIRLTSFLAGGALFIMLLSLRAKTRAGRLARREKSLRMRIGGELKMEEWITAPPRRAHFEASLLLSQAYPLELTRAGEEGVLCQYKGDTLLVACAQTPADEPLSAREVAAMQRACNREKACRGVLCGAGGLTNAARAQCALPPRVVLIGRERMIALAGAANPATNRQLIALGQRKRAGGQRGAWLRAALDCRRAPKYAAYGLLLLALYIFTSAPYYPVPGCACLILSALCRVFRQKEPKTLE